MRLLSALLILFVVAAGCLAEPNVPEELKANTVVIEISMRNHGTGLLFTRPNFAGDGHETFIWTVSHVVKSFMGSDGFCRLVPFRQGTQTGMAEVIRMGDEFTADLSGHDLALLRVTDGDFCGSTKFFRAFNDTRLGHKVIHCGTPVNPRWNERLVLWGYLAGLDRDLAVSNMDGLHLYDQLNLISAGGCSGGPVADQETGAILGLIALGSLPGVSAMEPTRHIYQWAKDHDCIWAFDREYCLPEYITPWPSDLHVRLVKDRPCMADRKWGSSMPTPIPDAPEPTPIPADTVIILDLDKMLDEAMKKANDNPFEVPPLITLPGQGPE